MWSSSAHARRMKSATPLAHFLKSHKRFLPLLTSLYLFRNTSLPSNSFFSSRLFPFYLLLISSAYFLLFFFYFFYISKRSFRKRSLLFHFILSLNCIFYFVLYDLNTIISFNFLSSFIIINLYVYSLIYYISKSRGRKNHASFGEVSRACTFVSHSLYEICTFATFELSIQQEMFALIGVA